MELPGTATAGEYPSNHHSSRSGVYGRNQSTGSSVLIATGEARFQGHPGPKITHPYSYLNKMFYKESLAPYGAEPFFLLAPTYSLVCYLTVPMLIPVLTTYLLPLADMGDIPGGGFLLAFGRFWPWLLLRPATHTHNWARAGRSPSMR